MGARAATTALVKQHDPVMQRVKIAPHRRAAPAPWPAVQDQNRHALGVAALFNVDAMALPNVDHALIEGFDRRVKIV
jgi:hypothetical protein